MLLQHKQLHVYLIILITYPKQFDLSYAQPEFACFIIHVAYETKEALQIEMLIRTRDYDVADYCLIWLDIMETN